MVAFLVIVFGLVALFFLVGGVRSAARMHRENPRWLRFQALNAGLWAGAILSLSQCFAVFRRFSGEKPNPHPTLNILGGLIAVVILLGCCVALGFFMYREDNRTGKLKRRMPLYDRFLPTHDQFGGAAGNVATELDPVGALASGVAARASAPSRSHKKRRRR